MSRTDESARWAGTWHDAHARPRHDPTFQQWMKVNRSAACPEARFADHIATSWDCRNKGSPCPRRTWRAYLNECQGTIRGCRGGARNATQAERAQTEMLRQYWAS